VSGHDGGAAHEFDPVRYAAASSHQERWGRRLFDALDRIGRAAEKKGDLVFLDDGKGMIAHECIDRLGRGWLVVVAR